DPDAFSRFTNQAKANLGFAEMPFVGWRDDVVVFMGPRLAGYSGLQVEDLTRVELDSRRRMMAHLAFFREHAPGFEKAWALLSGSQVGVRHTRRLIGLHPLVSGEWMEGARHDDEIGVSPSPSQAFANVSVPYGALVPANLDNVLVGGRHIATDPQSQAFMREIPQCWMTGQAAGAAAALTAQTGSPARDLPVGRLQQELRRQGVYLQQAQAVGTARS
ncbi:MAG: FAD-dependent oxidoreductase, partial [Acidimicrobiales bacterium]|nr:FAD-dependent oxidoreductase [Acidimicrobiales bacterium]